MRLLSLFGAAPVWATLQLEEGPSPVQRVVKLLTQMKDELAAEAAKDEKLYKDLQCWCKTNTKEKTAAIAEGKAKAEALAAEIKKHAGNSGTYKAKMEAAEKAVKEREEELESATKEHEEALKDLRKEESELTSTVASLDNALKVLSKHNSLLQSHPSLVQAASSVIHFASAKARILYGDAKFGAAAVAKKSSFLQAGTSEAVLAPALDDSYTPTLDVQAAGRVLENFMQSMGAGHLDGYENQSGPIFGILGSMKENFESDLKDTKAKIESEMATFEKMKKTLMTQLKAQRKAFADNKALLGKAKFLSTEGKEELQKIRDVVTADTNILSAVKSKCQTIDQDWALRTKARADEMAAVDKAIEIMTSDENRAALHPSFVQTRSKSRDARRSRAAAVLTQASKNVGAKWDAVVSEDLKALKMQQQAKMQGRLALVAQAARLDAFTKVKEMIDGMVADLKAQMAADVEHKDTCTKDIQENEGATRDAERLKTVTIANIEELTESIKKLGEDIEKAKDEVAETQKAMLKASQDREEENADFQAVVEEQRAMVAVLNKAYTVLKDHYGFVQVSQSQTPMPGQFEAYGANSGSSPVLAMMEKIMDDCKATEAEALKEEATSQSEYETFQKDSTDGVAALEGSIAAMGDEKSTKATEKAEAETLLKDTEGNLKDLAATNTALHNDCDFLLKFFAVRQSSMQDEIDACNQAKAILSGAM